ncbi:MAG: 30S ribosome-binding factor RbfA [Litorivicinus sp.]
MAREFKRADRLGEQIQREMAELLQFHSRESLPGLVTVSGVNLSRDMGYAEIHISVLGGGDDALATVMERIEAQKGHFRTELGRRLHVRRVPELRFHSDQTQEKGAHMRELINKARASDSDQQSPNQED